MFFIDFPDVIDPNRSNNNDAGAFTMGAYGKTYVYVRHMMWLHSLTTTSWGGLRPHRFDVCSTFQMKIWYFKTWIECLDQFYCPCCSYSIVYLYTKCLSNFCLSFISTISFSEQAEDLNPHLCGPLIPFCVFSFTCHNKCKTQVDLHDPTVSHIEDLSIHSHPTQFSSPFTSGESLPAASCKLFFLLSFPEEGCKKGGPHFFSPPPDP